jgi:hypothetical protein
MHRHSLASNVAHRTERAISTTQPSAPPSIPRMEISMTPTIHTTTPAQANAPLAIPRPGQPSPYVWPAILIWAIETYGGIL